MYYEQTQKYKNQKTKSAAMKQTQSIKIQEHINTQTNKQTNSKRHSLNTNTTIQITKIPIRHNETNFEKQKRKLNAKANPMGKVVIRLSAKSHTTVFFNRILCQQSETSRVDATVLRYPYTILFSNCR